MSDYTQKKMPSYGNITPYSGTVYEHKKTSSVTNESISLLTTPRFYKGFINGYKQPSVSFIIQLSVKNFRHMLKVMNHYFGKYLAVPSHISTPQELAKSFANILCALQLNCDFPMVSKPIVEMLSKTENKYLIWIPTKTVELLQPIIAHVTHVMNHYANNLKFSPDDDLQTKLDSLLDKIIAKIPVGPTTFDFITYANEENVPWKHMYNNTFLFGYGACSRWINCSLTDQSKYVSVELTHDKHILSTFLMDAGFPVAEQVMLHSESQAIEIAQKMQYPVVIKPCDQANGRGVFSNIKTKEELVKAYKKTSQLSKKIMIEKHVPGNDYRFILNNFKVIWAIERKPAGVVGDGLLTIETLVEQQNKERISSNILSQVKITESVINYLSERDLNLKSIPLKGEFIALNKIANVSTGGTPVPINIADIHPENKKLAENLMTLVGLDISGVDFISPDISVPFYENGGKIIEINAMPQLNPRIRKKILLDMVPNKGRIPVIVICADSKQEAFIKEMQKILLKSYRGVGLVHNNKAFINDKLISTSDIAYQAGNGLLHLKEMDCLIYCIQNSSEINYEGLPFDRYDHLICLNLEHNYVNDYLNKSASPNHMATLLKACQGSILTSEKGLKQLEELNDKSNNETIILTNSPPKTQEDIANITEEGSEHSIADKKLSNIEKMALSITEQRLIKRLAKFA